MARNGNQFLHSRTMRPRYPLESWITIIPFVDLFPNFLQISVLDFLFIFAMTVLMSIQYYEELDSTSAPGNKNCANLTRQKIPQRYENQIFPLILVNFAIKNGKIIPSSHDDGQSSQEASIAIIIVNWPKLFLREHGQMVEKFSACIIM